jgi:hypothetical protein
MLTRVKRMRYYFRSRRLVSCAFDVARRHRQVLLFMTFSTTLECILNDLQRPIFLPVRRCGLIKSCQNCL